MQRDAGIPSRLGEDGTPEDLREFLDGRAKEQTFDVLAEEKPFVQLAMFEQLRLAYGDDFYPRLHQEARRSESNMDPDQFFIVQASKTAGQDLTEFFGAWRLTISDETRAEVTELGLPAPERDLTAVDIAPSR